MTMKKVKVKLAGEGTQEDPFTVNLPTYVMDGEPDYGRRWAWILVPDDEVGKDGRLDEERIREKYREGWSKFRRKDIEVGE